jgi:hypothetical protein
MMLTPRPAGAGLKLRARRLVETRHIAAIPRQHPAIRVTRRLHDDVVIHAGARSGRDMSRAQRVARVIGEIKAGVEHSALHNDGDCVCAESSIQDRPAAVNRLGRANDRTARQRAPAPGHGGWLRPS